MGTMTPVRSPRPFLAGALAVAVVAVVSACSSGDDPSLSPVVDGGSAPAIPIETADGTTFDLTSTITITADGFIPLQAVAVFGDTLTFVNETEQPQTVTFTNGAPVIGGSQTVGPIAPGGSSTYDGELQTAISLVYEVDGLPGLTGRVQIEPGIGTL